MQRGRKPEPESLDIAYNMGAIAAELREIHQLESDVARLRRQNRRLSGIPDESQTCRTA